MLGETPLHAGPRSVFDYLSEKDRERLKSITAATSAGISLAAVQVSIPRTEPHIADAALRGFQPFTSDPGKQDRYTTYLQSQADPDGSVPPLKPLNNQRLDEFQKEVEDYAKAAMIFKPVSGAMAGRFQTAAHVERGPIIHEGLHQPTSEELEETETRRKKEEEEKLSPQAHAAKLGMYGPMTREVKLWQPARLLCKRFGLKEPDLPQDDSYAGSTSGKGPSFTTSEVEESFRQAAGLNAQTGSAHLQNQEPSELGGGPRNLANAGLGEDETQGRDTLTYQRPTMDVFKAIFASDDEESDEEKDDDVDEPDVSASKKAVTNGTLEPSHSVLDDKPVDLMTFKPTFIPRKGKAKKPNDEDRSQEKKERKDKKDKKKKDKKGPLVSFDVDEDGAEEPLFRVVPKERPKKKKRRNKDKRDDDDDEGMWVEKPAPEILRNLPLAPTTAEPTQVALQTANTMVSNDSNPGDTDTGIRRGRKRAVDFL